MPETGSTPEERTDEARRIMAMLAEELAKGKGGKLSVRGMEFYLDMKERFGRYGSKTTITPRQLFWLRDMKDSIL